MNDVIEDIRDLRKLVKASSEKRLRALGFPKHRSGTYFRDIDDGRLGFTFALSSYGAALKVEVSAMIRIDRVEETIFDYKKSIPDKFPPPDRPSEYTVSLNLGNIQGRTWRQWFIGSASEVEITVEEIENVIREVGMPFLDEFGSAGSLIAEMTSAFNRESILGSPVFFYDRYFTLLCMVGRCDLFREMRYLIEERVRDNRQTTLARVSSLLEWLDRRFCHAPALVK